MPNPPGANPPVAERAWNAFKNRVFEASKLVSTKTLLLKHYYRHQGISRLLRSILGDPRATFRAALARKLFLAGA